MAVKQTFQGGNLCKTRKLKIAWGQFFLQSLFIYFSFINRFKAKSKISQISIVELQYADDIAFFANTEVALICILDVFIRAYKV